MCGKWQQSPEEVPTNGRFWEVHPCNSPDPIARALATVGELWGWVVSCDGCDVCDVGFLVRLHPLRRRPLPEEHSAVSTPQPALFRERRMPVRTIGAVSASVIAFPLFAAAAAPASATTFPYPKPSRTLPAALDVAPFYQEGTRCLTENQPGAVAFAKLLNATY